MNPPSYFLRFPDRPSARIIALPASLGGQTQVHGLKWISSFPENVASGIPRASAVLILNDWATGYPFACLESSIISATRTAASAALAADWFSRTRGQPARVGFFGVGLIARYIHTFLTGTGAYYDEIGVYDVSPASTAGFCGYLGQKGDATRMVVHDNPEQLIRSSDLVVFATVAGEPHVSDPSWFDHNPQVLHVSLRDLAPEIVLGSTNIVDDVEHCLKANTSLHLAEQLTGNRDFVHGTLDDVMAGRVDRACRPAAGVLPLRPRAARPRGRQIRLRRSQAYGGCRSSMVSSTTCAGTDSWLRVGAVGCGFSATPRTRPTAPAAPVCQLRGLTVVPIPARRCS